MFKIKASTTPLGVCVKSASVVFLCLASLANAAAALTPRVFLHPDRIHYDSHCLTIDGKDMFIYSGAFHYFRCPEELWRDRFQKIKDAGFNCVETYVAWNWCEREMPSGLEDFSKVDLSSLDDFLGMAEEFGLYVIVRPGPYICAEWDTGGYPQWLLAKQPAGEASGGHWLRSDDPVYLAWCKHWYDAVCPVIARHQITRKAPGRSGVILMQLENEYDYARFPDDVKLNQVRALGQTARADGVDVPLITCWTHQVRGKDDSLMRQVFDCCNFYPRWNVDSIKKDMDKLRLEQPDAPLATTELQGGWFSKVGQKLSEDQDGINAAQINNLTLFAIQNGESLLNYYMLFGGSNPGDWAARDLTTTYDYNAPIREWGGVGDRYARVWAIGHMLQEHGARLARSEVVDCDVTAPQKDVTVVMRRAPDGSRYMFVRTSQHTDARAGSAQVKDKNGDAPELVFDYQLDPFGSKILYLPPGENDPARGQWLPKPAPAISRPSDLPGPVAIASAVVHDDSGPERWVKSQPGANLAQSGVYDSHFMFYRTIVRNAGVTNLLVEYPRGDDVLALVNGQPVARTGGDKATSVFSLPAGTNDVRLLYENHGHANGGAAMSQSSGISAAYLTSGTLGASQSLAGWRMKLLDGIKDRPEMAASFDDADWKPVAVDNPEANQLKPGQIAAFRAGLDMDAADIADGAKIMLNLARVDDLGWIYVNGRHIGNTTNWSRAYSFELTHALHPGHNTIAILVQNDTGDGGLGPTVLRQTSPRSAVPLSLGRPAGDVAQWWQPAMADADWKPAPTGAMPDGPQTGSILTWYRMTFTLPAPQPGVWIPWRLHLTAKGNGFLYLNGHELGRYWDAGPQHDFFLPECWLHLGSGQTNNLALNLRPLLGAAVIESAVVRPYEEFAEKR